MSFVTRGVCSESDTNYTVVIVSAACAECSCVYNSVLRTKPAKTFDHHIIPVLCIQIPANSLNVTNGVLTIFVAQCCAWYVLH